MTEPLPGEANALTGPSGRVYRLAPESLPPLERAFENRQVTRAYLLDVLESVRAKYPPEIFPMELVRHMGLTLRSLPEPWLREYAYAGMLAVLRGDDEQEAAVQPR